MSRTNQLMVDFDEHQGKRRKTQKEEKNNQIKKKKRIIR